MQRCLSCQEYTDIRSPKHWICCQETTDIRCPRCWRCCHPLCWQGTRQHAWLERAPSGLPWPVSSSRLFHPLLRLRSPLPLHLHQQGSTSAVKRGSQQPCALISGQEGLFLHIVPCQV